MPIEYRDWITRVDIKKEPDKFFLFGDNLTKKGMGGQAKEFRGEPNSIGIPTKRKPSMTDDSFFDESDYIEAIFYIDCEFDKIPKGSSIVVPKDGLGTGLSQLPQRAPSIYEYILNKLEEYDKITISPLNIYRVDIKEEVPWDTPLLFSCYCSSLEKSRKQISNFVDSMDVICEIKDYIGNPFADNLYTSKEFYNIIEINNGNILYDAVIKKLIVI